MNDSYQLGTTTDTITVDQDEVRISFGCDGDDIHCWTCGSVEALNSGAWIIRKPLARFAEHARYWAQRYPDLRDERKQTLICLDCSLKRDPNGKITKHVDTDEQIRVDREWAAAGIGAN